MGVGSSSYIDNAINRFGEIYSNIVIHGNRIKDIISFIETVDHFYDNDYVKSQNDPILFTAKVYFTDEIIKSLESHSKIEFNNTKDYNELIEALDTLISWKTTEFHDFYSRMIISGILLGDGYTEYANYSLTKNIMSNTINIFERKRAIVDRFYTLSPSDQIRVFDNIIHGIKYQILVYYNPQVMDVDSSNSNTDEDSTNSDKIEIILPTKADDGIFIPDPRYALLIKIIDNYDKSYLTNMLINQLFDKGVKSLKRAKMDSESFETLLNSITLYICKFGLTAREILINRIFNKMDYELLFTFMENTPSPRKILRSFINNSNNYLKKYIKMLITVFVDNKLSRSDLGTIHNLYFNGVYAGNKRIGIINADADTLDLCLKANEVEKIIVSTNLN